MRTILRRQNTARRLALWLLAQAVLIAACLLLAARSYPNYSLVAHDISFLGHPRLNPAGWWFWSAAMFISGAMLWPVATHIARSIRSLTAERSLALQGAATLAAFSARCSSIGLFGLALIPQLPGLDHAHELSGVLAMGGMYVALWLVVAILICSAPIRPAQALGLLVAVGWGPLGYLLTQGWRVFAYGESGLASSTGVWAVLLDFSLWEWLLLICLFIAEFLVVFCLPELRGEPSAERSDDSLARRGRPTDERPTSS